MIADERAKAPLRIVGLVSLSLGGREQLLEGAPRNQVEQFLLVAQVIVDSRERDSRTRGDIANRGEAEALLGEYRRGGAQDQIDVGVVAFVRRHGAHG